MKTVEAFLQEQSILDGQGNLDGFYVSLPIAMMAVQKALNGDLEMLPPSWIYNTIWEGVDTGTKDDMYARQHRILKGHTNPALAQLCRAPD